MFTCTTYIICMAISIHFYMYAIANNYYKELNVIDSSMILTTTCVKYEELYSGLPSLYKLGIT